MSKLIVTQIETQDTITPLTIATGNTGVSGTIKLETSNNDIVFTGNLKVGTGDINSNGRIIASGDIVTQANITGNIRSSGGVFDGIGNIRDLPVLNRTSSYSLTANDVGEVVSITTGNVFVNPSVFTAGHNVTVFNNSASFITITQNTGVTMYLAGTATTGNRSLAQRGLATLICVAANTFAISGAGLA